MKTYVKIFTLICLISIALSQSTEDTIVAPPDTGIVLEFREMLADVDSLIGVGDFVMGETLAIKAVKFAEDKWGEKDTLFAKAIGFEGVIKYYTRRFDLAESLFVNELSVIEHQLGNMHAANAEPITRLATTYRATGRYDDAEDLFKQAILLLELSYGYDHFKVSDPVNHLAILFQQKGNYEQAETLFLRALEIRESTLGDNHIKVASLLNNLASLYLDQGEYEKAEPLFKRVIEIHENSTNNDQVKISNATNNLGVLYFRTGRYRESEIQYLKALNILKSSLGQDNIQIAKTIHNLAGIYRKRGEYDKAREQYDISYNILVDTFGDEHPLVATTLTDMGILHYYKGEYKEAEVLYRRALQIREKILGVDHPRVATSLSNLALLYQSQGNFEKAEPLSIKVLDMKQKIYGMRNVLTASALCGLASIYKSIEEYHRSDSLYQLALEIYEESYGKSHPDIALTLNNVGQMLKKQGKFKEALLYHERALEMYGSSLGADHPHCSTFLNNIAMLHRAQSEYKKAIPLLLEGIAIKERSVGLEHESLITPLFNLGLVYQQDGQKLLAYESLIRSNQLSVDALSKHASYKNQDRMEVYLRNRRNFRNGNNNFFFNYYEQYANASVDWLNYILTFNSASGRSASAMRASIASSGDTLLVTAADEMSKLRGQIATLEMKQDKMLADYIGELEYRADSLEDYLTSESAEYRDFEAEFEVEWTDIQDALEQGEAAVEFTTAMDYDDSLHYYVGLVVKQGIEYPEVVRLANTQVIDTAMEMYSKLASPNVKGAHAETYSRKLYDVLWQPMAEALGGISRVYICPEGELYKVNFGILQDSTGQYVMEEYDIRTVTSTIDLTKQQRTIEGGKSFVIGAPDYNWTGEFAETPADTSWEMELAKVEMRSSRSSDIKGLNFSPLPEAEKEIKTVSDLLEKRDLETDIVSGSAATEELLKSIKNPKILHIATHGFVLEDQKRDSLAEGQIESPMLRTGLALTGANRIPKGIDIAIGEEDGILTASEMMELRLQGTDLVVLSACETGLGKSQTGEGVFGMRRALQLAGAEHLLLSLWAVPDKETSELMELFYTEYLDGKGPQEALRMAQTKMRDRVEERYGADLPYYWGAFVVVGI